MTVLSGLISETPRPPFSQLTRKSARPTPGPMVKGHITVGVPVPVHAVAAWSGVAPSKGLLTVA